MQFKWSDLLDVASYLADPTQPRPSDEPLKRTAVNRAYYAAFCHARDYAKTEYGYRAWGDARDHSGVRDKLWSIGRRKAATDLGHLATWRRICDYETIVEPPALTNMVNHAPRTARDVIDSLQPAKRW